MLQKLPGNPLSRNFSAPKQDQDKGDFASSYLVFGRPGERRDPYVDGPRATRVFSGSDRIACIHMSGLLMRSLWTAGQDGFRDASSKQPHDLSSANGSHGLSRTLDRSILPSALLLQLPLRRLANFSDRPNF